MKVYDVVDEGLGHSSCLIDVGNGTAAFIDPPRFPTDHLALADRLGVQLAFTFDTNSHADYVTGSPNLAASHDVTFVAPAASRLATAHRRVADGDRVEPSDDVTLTTIATPGHPLDHHAYLLTDHAWPVGLFTGGSLMIGTVGRTDLCSGQFQAEGAGALRGCLV